MKNMIFYDIMWYNHPKDSKYFSISNNLINWLKHKSKIKKTLSSDVSKFEKIINKYSFLYKNIPFVRQIYVCNSISFKSVHNDSDIDLFIVVKNNKIFLAKLFVWIFFKIIWMYWNHSRWKFCTWFFATESSLDLYPISLPLDLYLAYWISHLQVLYSEKKENKNDIFKENIWVKEIIPNYNFKHTNILKINENYWKWFVKIIFEKMFWFAIINNIIWYFWKKIMIKWKEKMWKLWKNIIISNNILKFQAPDIRKIVYLKYKTLKNNKTYKEKTSKSLF